MKNSTTKTKEGGQRSGRSLLELFTEQMNRKRSMRCTLTAANYRSCIRKLHTFMGGRSCSLLLHEVTPAWVRGWVAWLTTQHPEHPETVDFYFRNARAMYNAALPASTNTRGTSDNPFHGVRIKMMQPSKRALPVDAMREFLTNRFRERLKPLLRESFDVLQFIFYANGIVFQDVYNLRWSMINDRGHLRFLRSKTGSSIEICLVAEAREIIERYRCHDSSYVFPFLHSGRKNSGKAISEQSALRRVNLHASAIGKCAGLTTSLTTYVMRHTWATLMLESGKPVELISQCMGHTNIQTTQIYLSRISSARVEAGVNDMLNLVRSTPPLPENKKKLKKEHATTTPYPQEAERQRIARGEREKCEMDNLLGNRNNTEYEENKKDFPFLIKKEKIPLESF